MHHISCRARNWSTVSGQASQSVTFVDVNRKMNDEIDHFSFQLASLIPVKWRQVEQNDGHSVNRNGGMCGRL